MRIYQTKTLILFSSRIGLHKRKVLFRLRLFFVGNGEDQVCSTFLPYFLPFFFPVTCGAISFFGFFLLPFAFFAIVCSFHLMFIPKLLIMISFKNNPAVLAFMQPYPTRPLNGFSYPQTLPAS